LPYTILRRDIIQYGGRCPHESKDLRVVLRCLSIIAHDQPKKHLPLLADRYEDEKETGAAAFRLPEEEYFSFRICSQ
jgi:hypothetical protein